MIFKQCVFVVIFYDLCQVPIMLPSGVAIAIFQLRRFGYLAHRFFLCTVANSHSSFFVANENRVKMSKSDRSPILQGVAWHTLKKIRLTF